VPSRLKAAGADPDDGQWDARKRGDGNWQVTLTFTAGGRLHVAEWMFDPRRRHVLPEDDNAARLSLPDAELPPLSAPMPGEATVTPLAPRLGAVSAGGMGGASPVGGSAPLGGGPAGGSGPGGGGRFRAERPAHRDPLPERPPVASGTASDDSERSRPAPQRPLVFEEPDPAALDVQPALEPEPVATPPAPEPAAAANTEPAEESPARSRAGKKNARGRRSSVPSWDEIMLGSSRQQD
jgi:hypothetical protein